ncbi:DNA-protecting protein DprA [Aerococcaceae bacterium zg-BR9]|uniref:DNA-processing protein DprA n=1 Tax=Aerococcaceae bacterium zg-1292 TaxID=2774330 RepID=UPI004063CFCA|nr:DNA-protecting protein DprA [Aerococcaceae bacterium zg-BR9]MBF6977997.1 DNA-protecting protein DprA [Aerococcaceae bacterium zg-BR22]MBF6979233.1 DNA-protecting protein DprA [Aerococcaceae bacterium zg-BR22]
MKLTMRELLIFLKLKEVNYQEQCLLLRYLVKYQLCQHSWDEDAYQQLKQEIKQTTIAMNLPDWELELCYSAQQLAKKAIMFGDQYYPKRWYHIEKPPLIMFYEGNLSLLAKFPVSIVGSRKITPYGQKVTKALVEAFTREGWVSVSGMAKGIDAVVHQSAMNDGIQHSTIAIIATGLERCYPREHTNLQLQLGHQHLVLSEYLPNSPALKHHFIMRNRLVAGISPAICVMEAAKKSGSLITANYALQFNREVYALPGRINDAQSVGCNELIMAGATPILSIEETVKSIKQLKTAQD